MQKRIELSPNQKEDYANELLIYMVQELEKQGAVIEKGSFDFHRTRNDPYFGDLPDKIVPEGNDLTNFKKICNLSDDEFIVILNYCLTHKFIKHFGCIDPYNSSLQLTPDGQARAVSVERAKFTQTVTDNSTSIHIGSINGDNVQVGNNNSQNIYNTFYHIVDEIKKSDASDEEKKTALTKLKEFISNPIVSRIISSSVVEIVKKLIGGRI